MKKSKRKLKGMTLIEMIISIAIFAIMCGVLIGVGAHVDKTTRATNRFKDKIVQESPTAASRIKTYNANDGTSKNLTSSDASIDIKVSGTFTWYDKKADGSIDTSKKHTKSDPEIGYDTKVYSTEDLIKDDMTADEYLEYQSGANGGLNLKFIDSDPNDPNSLKKK